MDKEEQQLVDTVDDKSTTVKKSKIEKEKKSIKLWRLMLEAAIAFVMVFVLIVTNLFASIDYIVKDKLYQIPRGVSSDIKIIAIDDRTLEELGPIQTWSREKYAELIKYLNSNEQAKPAVIGFDITFSGNVDEGDEAFSKAARESGNVVVVSQFLYSEKPEYDDEGRLVYPIETIINPYASLKEATVQGYSNVAPDSDSKVRRITINQEYEGIKWEPFSRVVYENYCEKQGLAIIEDIPSDKYGKSLINYSGKPGDYEAISLVDVLNGKIDSRAFADSIVLVGAYASGMQDNFNVPNGGSRQMYGVEIHANLIQSYMQERFSVNANPYIVAFVMALVAFIMHILFRKQRIQISVVGLVVVIALELLLGVTLNNHGYCMNLLYLPLILIISFVYCLIMDYILERMKRKKVLNAFKKYVAPEIVEEIAKKGDFQIKLGGENRDIAVLFVDIRGFTTMSEVLQPEQVVEILNQYLNLTTQSIFKNKGTLDKFVGDATMAVFNSPFDLDDYEFRAVCAAMDIVEGGAALEKKLYAEFGRSVGFGVGVNVGPAVVGNVGCEFRMDFTAIGDTVNTAARLEANAKKGQVLISDSLYERVKDRVEVEEVGNIPLKGKSNGVFVYSVTKVHR